MILCDERRKERIDQDTEEKATRKLYLSVDSSYKDNVNIAMVETDEQYDINLKFTFTGYPVIFQLLLMIFYQNAVLYLLLGLNDEVNGFHSQISYSFR